MPSLGWDDLGFHPDHQAVGRMALESHFDSGVARLYPELGPATKPSEFYMFSFTEDRTHYVDIDGWPLKQKIAAYLAHLSQYANAAQMAQSLEMLAGMLAKNTSFKAVETFLAYY